MPKFLNRVTVPDLTLTGGTPAVNEVLVTDAIGAGSWSLVTDSNIASAANISTTKINPDELALNAYLSAEVFG
jgi:uncharacterized protein with ACT and thioredoxin-like domain